MQHNLLVLACSRQKRPLPEGKTLPAYQLYDGPLFQTLRMALVKRRPETLQVLILSARYGLVEADQDVASYDEEMTLERADSILRNPWQPKALASAFGPSTGCLVLGGRLYREVMQKLFRKIDADMSRVEIPVLAIGQQRAKLREWLESVP